MTTPKIERINQTQPLQISRVRQYVKISQQNRELFQLRNKQYGDAISRTGVLGAVVELVGVTARLEPLVLNNPGHFQIDETTLSQLENIFRDLSNYAIIAQIMLDDKNYTGEKYRAQNR